MGIFRRSSSDQPERRAEQDDNDDFLAQFLASNPQQPPVPAPLPPRMPSAAPAPTPASNEGISLADLLPDLFGDTAQTQPPNVPPPFPTTSQPPAYNQAGATVASPPPVQPENQSAPPPEIIAPQISAKEQKKRDKAILQAQKAREKELLQAQKEQERQILQAQKEQERQILQAQKEQEKSKNLGKKEQEEQARLARLGLVAAEGEELTMEQQAKLEAFHNLKAGGGGNSNTPIFVAIGVTLLVVALSLVLAFFIIPADIALGDMKAPEKSVRYEVKPSVIEQIKKDVIATRAYDEKKGKRVEVEMLAVTNPLNQNQILEYFNTSLKEKGYPNGQLLDGTLAYALSPKRLGTGGRPIFWPKSESLERLLVFVIPLTNNPGGVAAAADMVLPSETPINPNSNFIVMVKFKLPPD